MKSAKFREAPTVEFMAISGFSLLFPALLSKYCWRVGKRVLWATEANSFVESGKT